MKVIVARTAGFCSGVRDALERTLQIRREHPANEVICTFGPLIHNRQVLAMLEEKGIKETGSIEECSGRKVIIRAHGIPPGQRKRLKAINADIVDATCKRVARVQAAIKRHARKGYDTIIVGDAEHAEVIGLLGFTDGRGHVIQDPHQVDQFPEDWDKVLLVAQTTQNQEIFKEIEQRFRKRYPQGVVMNTICGATSERQNEVRQLCSQVDAMVIVGGYHSGNTVRLAEVARECLVPTYHIETEKELDPEKLAHYRTIGVSAGASTPNWMIRNVVRLLESIQTERDDQRFRYKLLINRLAYTSVYGALGAAFLVAAVSVLTGLAVSAWDGVMAGCYVFAMHSLNRYLDREAVQLNDPERAAFYRRWQYPCTGLSIIAICVAFVAASTRGLLTCVVLALLTLFGALYAVPILKSVWHRGLSIIKIKDIPTSKTLAVALAWATVTTWLPHLDKIHPDFIQLFYAFWVIFLLVFARTVFMDYLDIHGDRLAGRETVAVYLGERKTVRFLGMVIGVLIISLLMAPLFGLNMVFAYLMVPFVVCYGYLLRNANWSRLKGSPTIEMLIDSIIVAIGLLGVVGKMIGD